MNISNYYVASSVSGQDESNPALWLATQAGKMELSCLLGTTCHVPQETFLWKPYNKSFIDQACSVKMAGYWPRSFFARLWTSTPSQSIITQKKNLANIQPSWPHTWSITHTYSLLDLTCRGQRVITASPCLLHWLHISQIWDHPVVKENLCLQYLSHYHKRYSFWWSYKEINTEYWKGTVRLTVPRNLSVMYWILFVRHGFKSSKFYKECMSSLALLPHRNVDVFESQFLLEYYTKRAKNFTT